MKSYRIHATLYSDSRTGDVWTYENINSRLIKVKYQNKSIIVTNRSIDRNFEKYYNVIGSGRWFVSPVKKSLVIDSYYRSRLGMETEKTYDLTVEKVGKWSIFKHLRYLQEHPNDNIRITYWLAISSVVISTLLTIVQWISQGVNTS